MKDIALGIDIGGTKIFHALVDKKGEILSEIKKEATPKTVLEIEERLRKIVGGYKVDLAGIATAGAVSNENDRILSSTANLPEGYGNIDFQGLSETARIFLENDANAAAWAEYKIGVCRDFKNSIVVTLGTGVGGGIIVNNKLLKGKSGAAGEMHFKMSTDKKRKCTCGAWDCFEIYASGRGLKLTYEDIAGNEISTYEVVEKANNGCANAVLALKKWNEYIAIGILGLNNIFDAGIFALTGSMAQFADTGFIEEYVNKYTVASKTLVKLSSTNNYAGIIGSALVAMDLG